MMEIEKINFILPPGELKDNHTAAIKIWALTNPSKKIVVWYDSLADILETYYYNVFSDFEKLNLSVKEKFQRLNVFNSKNTMKYIEKFGGNALAQDFINLYHTQFKGKLGNGDGTKEIRDTIRKISDHFRQDTKIKVDIMRDEVKNDPDIKGGIITKLDPEIQKKIMAELEKDPESDWFPKIDRENLIKCKHGNIEIRDFYASLDSFSPKFRLLYFYEILCNRDATVARNLFAYMISNECRGEPVMLPSVYPTLNEELGNNSTEAMNLAIMKLEDIDLSVHSNNRQLIDQIHMMQNEKLFKPFESVDSTQIYASINETEAILNYLLLPKDITSHTNINDHLDAICKQRFDQIKFFPLPIIGNLFLKRLPEIISDKAFLENVTAYMQNFNQEFLGAFGTNNLEYVRQDAAKYSLYMNHILESTGTQFWSQRGIILQQLQNTNVAIITPIIMRRPELSIIYEYHSDRMKSNFDLDICLYIHEGAQHLGYVRYPQYSRKGMLFAYNTNKSNLDKLTFIESGITNSEGNRLLQEADARDYIQEMSRRG